MICFILITLSFIIKRSPANPLPEAFYNRLVEAFRSYMLVGGMPEAVATYTETGAYRYSCDLENFGTFESPDGKKIDIIPLYAISNLFVRTLSSADDRPEYQD